MTTFYHTGFKSPYAMLTARFKIEIPM